MKNDFVVIKCKLIYISGDFLVVNRYDQQQQLMKFGLYLIIEIIIIIGTLEKCDNLIKYRNISNG